MTNIDLINKKKLNYDEKKKIVYRIEMIKNKKKYIKLFKIINKDYKDYTVNKNGIFINLNSLQDKTLNNIINFLDKLDLKKNNIIDTETQSINDSEISYTDSAFDKLSETTIDESSDELMFSEIKLTTIEKTVFE